MPATSSVYQKIWTQSEEDVFIYSYISFLHVTMPRKREEGPNQGVHKEALPEGRYTFPFV